MTPRYGTLSVLDTLAVYNNTNVLEFGEEQMAGFVQAIIDAENALVADMLADFVGVVPARETTYGTNTASGDMVEVDEFGLADAQKVPFAPSAVGFPLRRTQYTLQWTRDYLAVTSPLEMATQVLGITEADTRYFFTLLRRTLLKATNATFVDRLGGDNKSLGVKALVNADSAAIPPQPITGTIFNAATHTHYLATASFVEANLSALEETVREHGLNGGQIRVYINTAQEATVRGFAGFYPYTDTRLIYTTDATRAASVTSPTNLEDRAIGFHGPAEVWVKPWMPASYVVANVVGGAGNPAIGWRRPEGAYAPFGDLRVAAELDRFPLHAQSMQRMLGFGAWNRTRAAVLYTASGTYASFTG
jgi:hypothetical protein